MIYSSDVIDYFWKVTVAKWCNTENINDSGDNISFDHRNQEKTFLSPRESSN